MKMVKLMRQNKPEYMKVFMEQGNQLVSYAESGDLPSIVTIIDSTPKAEILSYHIVKMVVAASLNFHFDIVFFHSFYLFIIIVEIYVSKWLESIICSIQRLTNHND